MSKISQFTILADLLVGGYTKRFLNKGLRLLPVAVLMAVLASMAVPAPDAYAATTRTIDVDNIADDNPEGGCTLREAIDVANAGLGPGTAPNGCTVTESGAGIPVTYEINLPSYTYTLTGAAGNDDNTSGDLDVIANVTLNGAGASSTIIDGGGIDRVLDIPISIPGVDLTLNISNVTIQNGRVTGSNDGGGIYNNGEVVTIHNSTIANNEAGRAGGGIYNKDGAVTISNSTISKNETPLDDGGGIYNNGGTLTIDNSAISNNKAGSGGIIHNDDGTVDISTSAISYNKGGPGGGMIQIQGGRVNISTSTIADNNGIGIVVRSHPWSDPVNVINSTISGNRGGGIRIFQYGGLNIANSTISNNLSWSAGGGIYSRGDTRLTNVTITGNIADYDNDGSGDGGGIFGGASIKNSIIAGNTDRSGGGPDCSGSFVSDQHNLIGINTGCVASFPGGNPNPNNDYVGTGTIPLDPLLGGLTGHPPCHLLQLASPAIDKIPGASCTFISVGTNPLFGHGDPVTTDQLGTTRDSTCDIGAFEVPPVGIQVLDGAIDIPDDTGSVNLGSTQVGMPITKTFTVRNIGKTTALTLSDLTPPVGFSIASDFGSTTVVTGGQTTFGIQFDANAGLAYTGELSFTNNVANRNPFNFTVIGTAVQLTLNKTASSDTAIPGQTLTYTLVVSNGGATNATNALVSDTLPLGLNFLGPVILDPGGLILPTPSLPTLASGLIVTAGERITLTFPVSVSQGLAHKLPLTNTAAVTSTEVTRPVTSTEVIVVDNPAKLSLTKTVDDNTPWSGQVIAYTLAIQNSGGQDATGSVVSDTLPLGLSLAGPVVIDPAGAGTPGTPPTLVSDLTISAGQRITVTFPVTVNTGLACGMVITNTAAVTSTEAPTPETGSVAIAATRCIYLPLILRSYAFAP